MAVAPAHMTRDGRLSPAQLHDLLPALSVGLDEYPYDQFRHYPARPAEGGDAGWASYLLARLRAMAADPEWTFFGGGGTVPLLLGARTARWDRDHFGMPIASLSALCCPDQPDLHARTGALLQTCIAELKGAGVTFVSARVNGDQLAVVHALEDAGFRYYENVLWPVAPTAAIAEDATGHVRLLDESEVGRAVEIAAGHGFARTHFLCDAGFERQQVEGMHAKWITTAWRAGDPIAVIEADGEIAGVFALRIDRELSAHLGPVYGRMRFLAVDSTRRGEGLGRALFRGSIGLLKAMGAEYIDSGYPTKNHLSARLHGQTGFHPRYEEATFHLWI